MKTKRQRAGQKILRALALLLVTALVLQGAPLAAFAAEGSDPLRQEEEALQIVEEGADTENEAAEEPPAESPAENGEDISVPPEETPDTDTTEEEATEPAPAPEVPGGETQPEEDAETKITEEEITDTVLPEEEVEESSTEEVSVSEEPLNNILGDAADTKEKYFATFVVDAGGQQKSWTVCVTDIKRNGTAIGRSGKTPLYEFDNEDNNIVELSTTVLGYDYDELMDAADDFASANDASIAGWNVYTDGFSVTDEGSFTYSSYGTPVVLNQDAVTYRHQVYSTGTPAYKTFALHGNRDYLFVAQLDHRVADSIYVSAIPAVTYDGKQHVAVGSKINAKTQSADLRFKVYANYYDFSKGSFVHTDLVMGKDYTVDYGKDKKRNTDASMRINDENDSDNGKYEKIWTDNSERPQVTITGKGQYKGFSATVYYDILPQNLGAGEDRYDAPADSATDYLALHGPHTYTEAERAVLAQGPPTTCIIKKGKLTKKISLKLTKRYLSKVCDAQGKVKEYSSTVTLKQGSDYNVEIYQLNSFRNWIRTSLSDPNGITEPGHYLLVLRGTGNYCGALYCEGNGKANAAQNSNINSFQPGDGNTDFSLVNPSDTLKDAFQFRVTEEDASYDISRATVSIKKKTLQYNGEVRFDNSTDDFGITVKIGKKVLERGKDYEIMMQALHPSPVTGKVRGANVYQVIVRGKQPNYYGENKKHTVTIKGIKLTKKMFKLENPELGSGEPKLVLTDAGVKAGLTLTGDVETTPGKVDIFGPYEDQTYSLQSSAKGYFRIAHGGYCGEAINRPCTLQIPYTRKALSLKDAVKKGMLTFSVADDATSEYLVTGADKATILIETATQSGYFINTSGNKKTELYMTRNGGTGWLTLYDGLGKELGGTKLTFTAKNNKTVGQRMKITIKAEGMFTGSITIDGPKVTEREISSITGYASLADITPLYHGSVYAVITDAKAGKNDAENQKKLAKPDVKLYQCYTDSKGAAKLAALGTKQYQAVQGSPYSQTATYVTIKTGTAKGFVFNYGGDDVTITAGSGGKEIFALYQAVPKAKDVTMVTWSLTGEGSASYWPKHTDPAQRQPAYRFAGRQLKPLIERLEFGGQVFERGTDFDVVSWGANRAAGKNAGSVTIRFKYKDSTPQPYRLGGTMTFKFDIIATEKKEM